MKRGFALILALALALLTGCEMFVPGPTERPSHWWGGAEPTDSAGPGQSQAPGSAGPSPSQAVWQEGSGTDFDRRFSKVITNICATGDTVYFSPPHPSNLIYYADKATGICLPLCGKPECTHSNENCNAYVGYTGLDGLASYNGRLYWVGYEKIMGRWKSCIVSMAYDGTDRRTVRELTDWTSPAYSGSLMQAEFHRGYIYKCYTAQEVVDGEAKTIAHVAAYSVEDDREALVILSEEISNAGQRIKIQTYEEYVYIALETADGAFELHRWDTRVGVLETLYRGTVSLSWTGMQFWVVEDGILFGSKEYTDPSEDTDESWEYALYRFSFETAEFEPVNRLRLSEEKNVNVTMMGGMVIANWWEPNSGDVRVLVKDFAGQTLLDAAFEDVAWYIAPYPLTGYGVDESYLYFFKYIEQQFIAVPRDGSEIRLLWSKDT